MKNKYMLKISLLSVSLLMGTAAAINGNIPALADAIISRDDFYFAISFLNDFCVDKYNNC